MLNTLVINDIVLIDKLDLQFKDGLLVMTGETGAGKSIVLDALGLVLGNRGDAGLVREGADKGSVVAHFDIPKNHPAINILNQQDITIEGDGVILRRVVFSDGKSKAFVNDQMVSVGFLRSLGDLLVEIHGQHDDRGLLNPSGHRQLLDDYAHVQYEKNQVAQNHGVWVQSKQKLADELARLEQLKADQEYDQHNLNELLELDPLQGEEESLDQERRMMMQGEKVSADLNALLGELDNEGGLDAILRGMERRLVRLNEKLDGFLDSGIEHFSRAAEETSLGIDSLRDVERALVFDKDKLDATEERLFALRALARKHRIEVEGLFELRAQLEEKLSLLNQGEGRIKELSKACDDAFNAYKAALSDLTIKRQGAAEKLAKAVMVELPALKLENAEFDVSIIPLSENDWGVEGAERVEFLIATNKGTSLAPMIKVASGGELSRVILALKVELAKTGSAPTLIFDEVDRGIGGATADAVGERLKTLSKEAQVIVVTHSPQVAARGSYHMRISKFEVAEGQNVKTFTKLVSLTTEERCEEIARMLSGAKVTDEARAAAHRLMKAS